METSDDSDAERDDPVTDPAGAADSTAPSSWQGLRHSVLLEADRRLVAGAFVLLVFGLVLALGVLGIIGTAKGSAVIPVFGATITGVFTIVSVVLSINQLVLSRVLGSPGEIAEKMDGSIDFRERIEDRSDVSAPPTDPAEFTRLVVDTLQDRAENLESGIAESDDEDVDDAVTEFASDIEDYADGVDEKLDERGAETFDVLSAVMMDNYSQNMRSARHLREAHADALSESARSTLEDVRGLLRAVGVTRQYLKTLYVHQELARLSRLLLYVGAPSLLAMALVVLAYALSTGPPVAGTALLVVVAAALALGFAPFAVLFAYVLRIATIARLSASIGPFTPKEESPGA
ncbi:hypothetical protein [Haloarchaeobius amylolyticus]|uniref:hypothetical protein n=1 Tax=Haloarchaeobius amylolyticus TaxID=1198296 RepID=UPI00226E2ADC|nr:hypothetical protein [Haloarchaeobius amylolyticus]